MKYLKRVKKYVDKKTADNNGINQAETSEEDDDADDMVGL